MTASQDRARDDIWGQIQRQKDLDGSPHSKSARTRQHQINYMRAKTNHQLARKRWLERVRASGDVVEAAVDVYGRVERDTHNEQEQP